MKSQNQFKFLKEIELSKGLLPLAAQDTSQRRPEEEIMDENEGSYIRHSGVPAPSDDD